MVIVADVQPRMAWSALLIDSHPVAFNGGIGLGQMFFPHVGDGGGRQ